MGSRVTPLKTDVGDALPCGIGPVRKSKCFAILCRCNADLDLVLKSQNPALHKAELETVTASSFSPVDFSRTFPVTVPPPSAAVVGTG